MFNWTTTLVYIMVLGFMAFLVTYYAMVAKVIGPFFSSTISREEEEKTRTHVAKMSISVIVIYTFCILVLLWWRRTTRIDGVMYYLLLLVLCIAFCFPLLVGVLVLTKKYEKETARRAIIVFMGTSIAFQVLLLLLIPKLLEV